MSFHELFSRIVLLLIFFLISSVALSDEKKKDDLWLPMEERVKIWDAVVSEQLSSSVPVPLPIPASNPKLYNVSSNGLEATFEKGGTKWTIVGANAPVVNPTVYPKDWPVKGNDFEVLVIPEPITNYKILSLTEKIENAVKSDTISITAAPDSYEAASFIIRSGDADLKNLMVEVTDMKTQVRDKYGKTRNAIIPKENIDIRVVKCWYQAGVVLNDTKHKLLTPELLLHDDDVVRVDYKSQVNLLKNREKIHDAERLKPFSVPKNQNKQLWITAHIEKRFAPGKYRGEVRIEGKDVKKELRLEIEVLPFVLPEPMLEYSLYYEGRLGESGGPSAEAGMKTEEQMKAELEDMKAHGLTNAAVWHRVNEDKAKWQEDWKRLQKTLDIRKEIGWSEKPLLYLDWRVSFKDDLDSYKEKIRKIIEISRKNEIKDIYIYGVDEIIGKELSDADTSLYKAVHDAGAKNFVAGVAGQFLQYSRNIDLLIVGGPIQEKIPAESSTGASFEQIAKAKELKKQVFIYGNPQAGMEQPETYRRNYGINLVKYGADGTLNYAYQTGTCWNDFDNIPYRYHVMAYPAIDKPIPTLQWEGWREGVNDVRYLTLLKKKNLLNDEWMKKYCPGEPNECRKNAIKFLIN